MEYQVVMKNLKLWFQFGTTLLSVRRINFYLVYEDKSIFILGYKKIVDI